MDAFIGEIRPYGFNFAPSGWLACKGQILAIQQYTALFSILGTQYGGNGTTTFALPNLQAAVAVGAGTAVTGTQYLIGELGGASGVAINISQMPAHNHNFFGGSASLSSLAQNAPAANTYISNSFSKANPTAPSGLNGHAYSAQPTPAPTALSPQAVGITGSNTPHNNMMPYLGTNYCICINGIFPSRN